ncbi:MAG TPA: hypothetical protein VMS56_07335 [Thermoanaerobaculia bacterium]|nr:hypothetical protein [Thermoanaerobaculia bacterium]
MPSPSASRFRAALLATAMNLGTAAPLDPFRFLRVPAIHFILRRKIVRWCASGSCGTTTRRRSRWRRG